MSGVNVNYVVARSQREGSCNITKELNKCPVVDGLVKTSLNCWHVSQNRYLLKNKTKQKNLNFTSEVTLRFHEWERIPSRLLACIRKVIEKLMETSCDDGKLFLPPLTAMPGLRPLHGGPDGCGSDSLLVLTLVIPEGDRTLGACTREVGSSGHPWF